MLAKALTIFGGIFSCIQGFVAAHPDSLGSLTTPRLFKRVISPDATCGSILAGKGKGYTCGPITDPCCSGLGMCRIDKLLKHGIAGKVSGCQPEFGRCGSLLGGNDSCGMRSPNGAVKCPDGACCSQYGNCGTTKDFCISPECQVGYGKCDADILPRGNSTANISRPELGSVPYGEIITTCDNPGHVALTFDDGPYIYTDALLDLLASYNFKATFFITGINLGKGAIDDPANGWDKIIKRAHSEGHQIASHTWSHPDLSTLNETQRELEIIKLEMAMRNILGKFSTYMRPPFVSCDAPCLATMKRLGYHVVNFDLDTQDWRHDSPDMIQISKDIVHNGLTSRSPKKQDYLILNHDINQQTVHNLTAFMLDDMVKLGWKGVTAGACKNDPEENWYRTAPIK
ncbi:hypothetical protein BDD12DRAFT_915328 [Trichophaea hybrida]|nr:hypothetical protein BDD12DRAFT_915328 [Trichophaea hybrida]